jgi:ABC-2 type transport system ATP-binding protein
MESNALATSEKDAGITADVLRLENVTKTFGHKQAVRGVSLSVRQGEVFGFLGPNGAGKSTTIRMILDVLRPSAGVISLFGQGNRHVVATHRRIGYLSGDMVMDANLTGRQYLEFVAAQYKKDCRHERQRLALLLQADLAVKIGNYSRGNRQKIGLIAALQHQPELLILDEPTSGFDPLVQEQFANLVQTFKQTGGTVFMSSHILSEVQQLCDRVAFIKDGQIVDTTTIEKLTASAAKRVRVRAPIAQLAAIRTVVAKLGKVRFQPPVEEYMLDFSYGGQPQALLQALAVFPVEDVTIQEPELEEIFMHYYQKEETGQAGSQEGEGKA